MSVEARLDIRQKVATLTLTGEADSESAPRIAAILDGLADLQLHRLELDLSDLSYLSSAGLRCVVFAHQRLGRSVEIVVVNASAQVAETIRLTGFDRSITMRQDMSG